jgi:mRNA interferase RelE/StbE
VDYTIQYKSSVKKELKKLNQSDRKSIVDKIEKLKKDPKPQGSAKLKGSTDLYRIRQGDYRVIYRIQNNVLVVLIIRIGHRRDIYKSL